MIKLKQIKANMTELTLDDGTKILFSYETPVAGWDNDGAFRTTEHYSPTTTRHINQYLGGKDVGYKVSPNFFDRLFLCNGY